MPTSATQAPDIGSQRNTGAMATRMTSSRVVGRGTELAELEAALADSAAGKPSIVFVAGESGVGKTRLLAEFERHARASSPPARVIGGDCVELGEGELPYAPLVAALRPLARVQDPVVADLPEATRGELGALVPGLAPARSDGPGWGGHAVKLHCADALCTPSVNTSTKARNVRKIVRVIN